ncbi:hypothetical protein KC953_00380 [Candidatus Saccharibacteria bacterium]|nr:hypothetical protein [Candidatus Saccharibacteria bacterium]
MPPVQGVPPQVPVPPPVIPDVSDDLGYMHRWVKRFGIALGVLAVFSICAVMIASVIWNDSSEKALLDATQYALDNPGKYTIQQGDKLDATLIVRGNSYKLDGKIDAVPLSAIVQNRVLYMSSSDPQLLYDTFLKNPKTSKAMNSLMKGFLPTLKNRWIRIDLDSDTNASTALGTITCLLDMRYAIGHGKGFNELAAQKYVENAFLNVRKTTHSTYRVTVDTGRMTTFQDAVSKGSNAGIFDNCPQLSSFVAGGKVNKIVVDVALTDTDNVLKTIEYKGLSDKSTKISASYTDVGKISPPKDAVDISQMLSSILQSIFGTQL